MDGLVTKIEKMEKTNNVQCAPVDPTPFWERQNNRFKYCWSCGSNATHASATCTKKKADHKDEATYQNRMGGSTHFIPKRFR